MADRRVKRRPIAILAAVTAAAAIAASFVPAFPQDPAYHDFADRSRVLGIAHFGDVASNLGFLLVGTLGLAFMAGRRGARLFAVPGERWPFRLYFAGLAAAALGSGYYHLDPSNAALAWDRLALSVPTMALLAAFIVDRIHNGLAALATLPVLLILGAGSVVTWHLSEAAGHGDLRFYALVQILPVLLIPLICLLFEGRHTSGKYVLYMVFWYLLARICELLDRQIDGVLGGLVSGHTLKHLFAAVAAYAMLAMLRAASRTGGIR